jgi:hypothetical protein
MPEYLEQVERDTPLEDTKRKKKRWAKQFLDLMGDLEVTNIKPNMPMIILIRFWLKIQSALTKPKRITSGVFSAC